MRNSIDVCFFEIGKESGTDFAKYIKTSLFKVDRQGDAAEIIDEAVRNGAIPDSQEVMTLSDDVQGGMLDIKLSGENDKICVFFLNDDTESHFYDKEPVLNLKPHGLPAAGHVSGSSSYPSQIAKTKWASFTIKRAMINGKKVVTVPFMLNIVNEDTGRWPSLNHHHDHVHRHQKDEGKMESHGGIHPNTPANFVSW